MNYLNGQSQNAIQPSSVSSLQTYITQLTVYINENNQKYTRNLQKLKNFYEQQIHQLNDNIVTLDEDILRLKNQNITFKDLLVNRDTEIGQLKLKIEQFKKQNDELQQKCKYQRERNQQVYQHMDQLRTNMQQNIDKEIQRSRKVEQDRAAILLQLKQKQSELKMFKTQILALEEKVAERYTLPERYKQLQIQNTKDKTNIINLQQKINELTKQRDFAQMELERKRKQNQKLTIQANKNKTDLSFEIQQAVKKEKEKLNGQIDNLKIENERKVYEIKDLQIKLKEKVKQNQKLENALNDLTQIKGQMQKQIKSYKDDKDLYLNQFSKLKYDYERIIGNLENAIPEYQKKNWALEQQNKDLNEQLDGLQQLLRQLRAMNDMEPMRKQYRQWAELHLAADRKLPQQISQIKQQERKTQQRNYLMRINQTDISPDWEKLLHQIQKIQI